MKKTLKIILYSLLITFVVLIVLNFTLKEFDIFTYLSAISSFVIAILTVFYVSTTSSQLDIMSNQLNEMKKDRELQSQPLPWLENITFEIEAPTFFYSPPNNEHCFISRYRAFVDLVNLSDCPAICIDISSKLIINNKVKWLCTSERVDTLGGKERYPKNKKDKIYFLFPSDDSAKLFDILRDSKETPLFKIDIIYRNILGAYFLIENEYQLFQKKGEDEIINKWHTDIISFPIKEKGRLESLVYLKKTNPQSWDELFYSIKNEYKYEQEKITLNVHSLPGSLKINPLSIDEYEKRVAKIYYGKRLKTINNIVKPQCEKSDKS